MKLRAIQKGSLLALALFTTAACEGDTIYYIYGDTPDAKTTEPDGSVPDGMVGEEKPIETGDILIGVYAPNLFEITGPTNRATQLALDEVNAVGGLLNSRTVKQEYGPEPRSEGLDGFVSLVDNGAVAVIGPMNSDNAVPALPVAKTREIPFFSLFGPTVLTFSTLQPSKEDVWGFTNFWSAVFDNGGPAMAGAKTNLSCASVGWVGYKDADPAVTQLAVDEMENSADAEGLTWKGAATFDFGDGDFSEGLATAFMADPPECVLIEMPATGYVIRDWAAVGSDAKFIIVDDVDPTWLEGVLTAQDCAKATGGMVVTRSPVSGPEMETYVAAYETAFGDQLNPNTLLFMGSYYDYAAMTLLAIEKAGSTDGKAIRDAIQVIGVEKEGAVRVTPGALAEGLAAIREGKDINYDGTTGSFDYSSGRPIHELLPAGYLEIVDLCNMQFQPFE